MQNHSADFTETEHQEGVIKCEKSLELIVDFFTIVTVLPCCIIAIDKPVSFLMCSSVSMMFTAIPLSQVTNY